MQGDQPLGKSALSAQELIDIVGLLRDCGVTTAYPAVPPVKDKAEFMDHVEWFAAEVRPHFS